MLHLVAAGTIAGLLIAQGIPPTVDTTPRLLSLRDLLEDCSFRATAIWGLSHGFDQSEAIIAAAQQRTPGDTF